MPVAHNSHQFHPMPVIGHPEAWYHRHIEQADAAGDVHAHHAYKVGQYVTLALDPKRAWEEKSKYFRHVLKHHCVPPPECDEQTIDYYQKLHDLVCRYASQEALRLARHEHEAYTMRLDLGVPRETLVEEAEVFFPTLLGHGPRPDFITPQMFDQIRSLRDKWI